MTRQTPSKKDSLTSKQAQAITALLSSPTLAQAATASGLSERTIQRYMALPHFRQALAEAENEAMTAAARQLAVDAYKAAQTLRDIMSDKTAPAAARVNAARAWLALTPGFREHVALEARLQALEAALLEGDSK